MESQQSLTKADATRYAMIAKCLVDAALNNHCVQEMMRDTTHTLGALTVEQIMNNPPVRWEFEHATAVGELTGTRHLWKKNWGELIGVLPVEPETPVDRCRWLHIFKDTCPYQIRFMQRRRLKELLGKRLRKFVGLAMRSSKKEWIDNINGVIVKPVRIALPLVTDKPRKPWVDPGLLAEFLKKLERKLRMDAGTFWRAAKGKLIVSLPKKDVQGEMF